MVHDVDFVRDMTRQLVEKMLAPLDIAVAVLVYLYEHCFGENFCHEECTREIIANRVLLRVADRYRGYRASTIRNWVDNTLRRFAEWGVVEVEEMRFLRGDRPQERRYVYRVKPLMEVKRALEEAQRRLVETFRQELQVFFVNIESAITAVTSNTTSV